MKKQIVWYGPPYSYSGYATHNRCTIFELHKLGWNIRLIPTEEHIPEHLIGAKLLKKLAANIRIDPKESLAVNLIPPPALPCWGKYTVLYTTLESSTVHEGFMRRCKQFDEVWVPCKANIKSMLKAGFPRTKLQYCPEGVYPEFWTPYTKRLKKYESKKFTFFFNGDWSYRKGLDVLIKTYCKAFIPTDNVRLLLLVHYQGNSKEKSEDRITQEFHELLKLNSIYKYPEIKFIWEFIPDPYMPDLYNCSDIFAFPTRGEAWGLPAIQSMACEKPVICTEYGGHLDYCNSKNSYLIKVDKFDTIDDKTNCVVDFYRDQKFAFINEKHFIKTLQYCYQHQDEVKQRGKRAREHIIKYFKWQTAGRIADRRLTQIVKKEGLG